MNETFNPQSVTFEEVPRAKVREFIQTHYLGSFPAVSLAYVGILYNQNLIGVVIYGRTSAPSVQKSIFKPDVNVDNKDILELQRLFIIDDETLLPKEDRKNLAGFSISHANDFVVKKFPNVKVILSYSDPDHHLGTVYKATNAIYQGRGDKVRMFKRADGKLIRTNRVQPEEKGELVSMTGKDRWVYPVGSTSQKKWVKRNLIDSELQELITISEALWKQFCG